MGGPRAEPSYAVQARLKRQLQRLGTDARTTRVSEGMSQVAVAARARVSQKSVARVEAGDPRLSVGILTSVFAALGMDLAMRAYPGAGVRLRDSGQIQLTEVIRAEAHPSWNVSLEAPAGDNGQAADLLLLAPSYGIHLEVESTLIDLQAQLRRGLLKRDALQHRLGIGVAFVMALRDSVRNRTALRGVEAVATTALPATPYEVLTAVRMGSALARDGLLWVRPRRREDSPAARGLPAGRVSPS